MNTIIVYATKHGAARKCANMLAEKITGSVELFELNSDNDTDISKYDSVIIGGSIYAGHIQKQITEFCRKNLNNLLKKKIGLFISCMNAKAADDELKAAFSPELADIAAAKDSFGGEFKFKEMNFMEKAICKMVAKMLAKEDSSLQVDTKQDVSLISAERIGRFADIMNKA